MFVVEINGHRVDTLTLRDLEKTRYKTLAAAIKQFLFLNLPAVGTRQCHRGGGTSQKDGSGMELVFWQLSLALIIIVAP